MKRLTGLCLTATLGAVSLIGLSTTQARALPMPAAAYGQEPWNVPPTEFGEMERRGFHDGVEGARKDADNHRRPDVRNRDEYRHPHVPGRDKDAYRRGFERGYNVGVENLIHGRY